VNGVREELLVALLIAVIIVYHSLQRAANRRVLPSVFGKWYPSWQGEPWRLHFHRNDARTRIFQEGGAKP